MIDEIGQCPYCYGAQPPISDSSLTSRVIKLYLVSVGYVVELAFLSSSSISSAIAPPASSSIVVRVSSAQDK